MFYFLFILVHFVQKVNHFLLKVFYFLFIFVHFVQKVNQFLATVIYFLPVAILFCLKVIYFVHAVNYFFGRVLKLFGFAGQFKKDGRLRIASKKNCNKNMKNQEGFIF